MSDVRAVDETATELDSLDDGRHHLWCKTCHPEWEAHPLGAELGVPFTAWCGVRAILLVPSAVELPADACPACAAPDTTCPVCGAQ